MSSKKSIDEMKKEYLSFVYEEMMRRGVEESKLEYVISKTGFIKALNEYPEESLHYPVESSVDEILLIAAKN